MQNERNASAMGSLKYVFDAFGGGVSESHIYVMSSRISGLFGLNLQPYFYYFFSGLIYQPFEPILLQSISNPFIFRCIDRLLIDGNDKGLSRFMYRYLFK